MNELLEAFNVIVSIVFGPFVVAYVIACVRIANEVKGKVA